MKVTFFLKKGKGDYATIYVRYSHASKNQKQTTNLKIKPSDWNSSTKRPKQKKHLRQTANRLNVIEEKIMSIASSIAAPLPSIVFAKMDSNKVQTIEKIIEDFLSSEKALEESTINVTSSALDHLLEYCKKERIKSLDYLPINFDAVFLDMILSKGLQNNTAWAYMSKIKKMFRYTEGKYHSNIYYKKWSISKQEPIKPYLYKEELKILEKFDAGAVRQKYLDFFLFMCYTGLRWHEFNAISDQGRDGNILTYQKAKQGYGKSSTNEITLSRKAQSIWEKYNFDFPNFTDESLRTAIKQISKEAGLDRLFDNGKGAARPLHEIISTHVARGTFATLLAENGVPLLQISRALGHNSVKTTETYIKRIRKEQTFVDLI